MRSSSLFLTYDLLLPVQTSSPIATRSTMPSPDLASGCTRPQVAVARMDSQLHVPVRCGFVWRAQGNISAIHRRVRWPMSGPDMLCVCVRAWGSPRTPT
eukprot:3718952-Rhodomonas_salina.3